MRTLAVSLAVAVLVAAAILGALEVLPSGISCTSSTTLLAVQTTSVGSTATSTNTVKVAGVTTQTERAYNLRVEYNNVPTNPTPRNMYGLSYIEIPPKEYAYQDTPLVAGMSVSVGWSANRTLDVYILNSTENAVYAGSNATKTSPNIASSLGSQTGSLSFHVPANDLYFFILFNPRNGSGSLPSQWVALYNASGIATFSVTTTATTIRTTTSIVSVPQPVTSTQIEGYPVRMSMLSQIEGRSCPG